MLSPLARSFHALTESSEKDISQAGRLIRQHDALLVLDGVADVRHPAGVEELLAYCPGIRIISTSRTPWQLAGLYAAVISPLATPDAGPDGEDPPLAFLGRVPAMRLLVDRLSEVRPGFELSVANASAAAEMCRKLDGLPVALEVAARQFRVLSLHQLAEVPVSDLLELTVKARPDGAPETIASLLRWSVERQEAAPRELLRELVSAERALTVTDMARALRRPLDKVVDDLGGLIGCGLVRALHGEATTALHVPNLLRAFLLSERPTGVLAERSRG